VSSTQAFFNSPTGIVINSTATYIYIAETGFNNIRKINMMTAMVSTLLPVLTSPLSGPQGVAVDSAENLYITDTGNHKIMKYSSTGVLTTFAGSTSGNTDATGTAAKFNGPTGILVSSTGIIYIADTGNNLIRKITAAGVVSTFVPASAGLNGPRGIALDSAGILYVADTGNSRIRKVSSTGVVTPLAGTAAGNIDGPGATAAFTEPQGITVDRSGSSGNLYVADTGTYTIRKIAQICDPTTGL
jgi:sugar lactone lactonase YvrE